ncbi:hypothetical protein PHYPSEUDO_010698 [Phytophthora pseudosyringae]|uniref:Uncharacterized protein n=1 Tax=Phytophthora pseudosyringae TaxID=221518 RepID=A0A8T1VEX4_9STRA|nr:hypothetical protein PHYPSEUDO_010698 [Phytophthora pseudosyringae]
MGDVLLEPEDMATVAEALAFIDACESSSASVSGSTSGSDSARSPLPEPPAPLASKPKRKRHSKNPAGYSTRLLHRKKAEMQQLRDEAAHLEAQLGELTRSRAVGVGALAAHASQLKEKAGAKWMEMAAIELQRRQSSEQANRKLRALVASQAEVDAALRSVVMNKSVLKGMDLVLGEALSSQGSLAAVDNSSVIMAELENKVSHMYLDSRVLFGAADAGLPTISCEMKRRVDRERGQTVEIASGAPLACSMEAAASSLWKELTTIRTYPDKSYRYMQTSAPNAMEKNFDQILRGQAGAATPINGLQFMRKFDEAERVVLARAYRMLLPTDGMHLCANAWTVFSRSKSNPMEECEVRAFVQLYMEVQPGFSARPEDVAYLKDVAFETWSMKMRSHTQYLQEVLIEAASRAPAGASQLLLKSVC